MAKKCFGQHFLNCETTINHLLQCVNPLPTDRFIEIGAGQGALTGSLLSRGTYVDAIEVESNAITQLKKRYSHHPNLAIHSADALKMDFQALWDKTHSSSRFRLIGNLPYNIGTPLLFHCLNYIDLCQDMHFMLQKEVVQRLAAKPGTKSYGRLSVMVQYHCETRHIFDVPPSAFWPPPQVMSSVCRLHPITYSTYTAHDLELFSLIVKQAFSQRRKKISNSLGKWLTHNQLEALGIDPNLRPEQLTVRQFVAISNQIHQEYSTIKPTKRFALRDREQS